MSSKEDCCVPQGHQKNSQCVFIHASSQLHMHDIIFHVIFGSDFESIFQMVSSSAARIHSVTNCPFLHAMMKEVSVHMAQSSGTGRFSCAR
jgi:hypothetical protein